MELIIYGIFSPIVKCLQFKSKLTIFRRRLYLNFVSVTFRATEPRLVELINLYSRLPRCHLKHSFEFFPPQKLFEIRQSLSIMH
jgi:hypothetical protein